MGCTLHYNFIQDMIRWHLCGLTVLAAAFILSGCVGTDESSTQSPAPTPTPSPTESDTPADTELSPTPTALSIPQDISASHFGMVDAARQGIEEIRALGIAWDRPHPGPFVWGHIEPQQGQYRWHEADGYVQTVQSQDMATLATIWPFAPWDQANWGTSDPGGLIFERELGRSRRKPNDMDAYKAFVSALVERYDGDGRDDMPGLKFPIKHWEASNEPSNQGEFHTFFDGSPEDYLEVLSATYQAVKEADPEAKVLHAGMAGVTTSEVSFWEPVFAKGNEYFDIANIHSIEASDKLYVPEFKELLAKHGIDKPIWVTEVQHNSDIGLEEHAQLFARSYLIAFGNGAEKIFYTMFRVPPFAPAQHRQAALIGDNGEKRPAYHALKTLVTKLDGFTSVEKLSGEHYVFTVDGEEVHVLWGTGTVSTEAGQIVITDIFGQKIDTPTIELSRSPVFIEGEFSIQAGSGQPEPPEPEGENGEQWQEEKLVIPGTYCDADVVRLDNGRLRMYYSLEPEAPDFEGQVYSAISEDGINWVEEEGARLKWATFPSVIRLPEAQAPEMPSGETARWRMYFQGSPADAGPEPENGIVSALSADGLDWALEDGFRIETGQQGEYDTKNVAAPTVVQLADGTYLMVYRGSAGENRFGKTDPVSGQPAPIDYLISAPSPDGLNWTPRWVVIDSRNEEMRDQIDGPEVVISNGTIKLYCNSYEGVYALEVDQNGEAISPLQIALPAEGYHAPSDVSLIQINGTWRMYYGIHTEGIYTARTTE